MTLSVNFEAVFGGGRQSNFQVRKPEKKKVTRDTWQKRREARVTRALHDRETGRDGEVKCFIETYQT